MKRAIKRDTRKFLIAGLAALAGVVAGIAWLNSGTDGPEGEALVGKPLPSIQLVDGSGKPFALVRENFKGKNVVLFFNEGLMCYPACWDQMAAFGKDRRFKGPKTLAVSVVTDPPQAWQQAVAKMPELREAATLFDEGAKVSRQLGVLTMRSSMHPGQMPGHTYILVDTKGIVREVFDDPDMKVNNDLLIRRISKLETADSR